MRVAKPRVAVRLSQRGMPKPLSNIGIMLTTRLHMKCRYINILRSSEFKLALPMAQV